MPPARKKSYAGLIIGLIAGGIALIVFAVIIGIAVGNLFNDSINDAPPLPPEAIENQLLGMWAREDGDYIWFFGNAEIITFTNNVDGTLRVTESEYDEVGTWYIDISGDLVIDGDWTGNWKFSYIINNNRLTLIDSDGDSAQYSKVG